MKHIYTYPLSITFIETIYTHYDRTHCLFLYMLICTFLGLMQVNDALAQRVRRLVPGLARPGGYLRQMAFEIPVMQPPAQDGPPVAAGPAVQQVAQEFPVQAFGAEFQSYQRELIGGRRQPGQFAQPGQPEQLEPPPRMPLRNTARRER
jgi:hypothetical protein